METKIKNLAMHTSILKEIWNYFEELYSERNNLNIEFLSIFMIYSRIRRATKLEMNSVSPINQLMDLLAKSLGRS